MGTEADVSEVNTTSEREYQRLRRRTRAALSASPRAAERSGDAGTASEHALTCTRGREVARSRAIRAVLAVAGIISVGLGIAGVFIPLLPTTPFLLLAAACFARSSERFYRWLLANKLTGDYVRHYIEHRATTLATKVGSIATLWSVLAIAGIFFTENLFVRALLLVVGVGVTIHLLSLKTLVREPEPVGPTETAAEGAIGGSSARKGRT
jgi:uncharacterized membrane protein YbaN (DUF454 family)